MEKDVIGAQNSPEALKLLAASLQCDRYSRLCQATYVGVTVLGPLLLLLLNGSSPLVNDAVGLAQGAAALLAFGYAASWRQDGSNLRADFERQVFGFPAWMAQSRLKPDRVTVLASRLERDPVATAHIRDWFDLPAGLTRNQEVMASMHQSVRYGQALRAAWAAILGALCLLVATFAVLVLVWTRPASAGDWHIAIVTAALLSILVAQSINAWRYSRDRGRLRQTIEALCETPVLNLTTANLIMHERLVALRQYRVLVPTVLYRLSRKPLRRATFELAGLSRIADVMGAAGE